MCAHLRDAKKGGRVAPLRGLQDGGERDPAPSAKSGHPHGLSPLLHRMDESDHDPASGGAYRMAEANPGAVDVDAIPVEPEFALAAKILGGESLVHFDQLEIGEGETSPAQEVPDGGHGAQPHDRGMATAAPH